jgi:peptidylprolyl isomerase
MENNNSHMNKSVAAAILIIVIAGLVYITVTYNKKAEPTEAMPMDAQALQDNNQMQPMDTTQQDAQAKPEATATATAPVAPMKTADVPGVKITILKEGTGAVAKSGDTVAMNYTGTLSNGTKFDSNVDPSFKHVEPFVFTIGGGQVIKGWDAGIAGMKVGEKRKLVISPDYGYGAQGAGGVIPGNATLTFEVELLAIK